MLIFGNDMGLTSKHGNIICGSSTSGFGGVKSGMDIRGNAGT